MAENHRNPNHSLIDALLAEPERFDLVQAIALLERISKSAVPLGEGMDPELESLRIEQDPTMAFPAGDVTALRQDGDGRYILRTPAFGVSGLIGPLPYAYTEVMLERSARRDRGMAAFLDLFNHRIVSILYRIRRSTLPLLDGHPESSVLGAALRALVGIGMNSLSGRLADVPDRVILAFAGLFANQRRSASALATVLSGVFRVKADIRSFEGRWLTLRSEAVTRLDRTAPEESRRLGEGAILGSRVWDQHAGFVVHIRLESLAALVDLLPSGRHHRAFLSICRFHSGPLFDIVVELKLAAKAVPPLRLSSHEGARLGWVSWLLGKEALSTADGVVRFTIPAEGGQPA